MKPFIIKIVKYFFIFYIVLEILSRIFVDPLFYFKLDTFRIQECKSIQCILNKSDDQPDYLFLGSSRVAALVNQDLLSKLSEKHVVNSARGYMTPGIMIHALESKLRKNPDFLKNSKVFLEYYGQGSLTNLYKTDELKVYESYTGKYTSQPQIMLPHINFSDLKDFWSISSNSYRVKLKLTFLYFSAAYRCGLFVNEKFNYADKVLYKGNTNVSNSGGIRNDYIQSTIQFAKLSAKKEKQRILSEPLFTSELLDESSLAKLNELIRKNGGELVLFKIPLHSISKEIFNNHKSKINNQVFEEWLISKNINLIEPKNLHFKDQDFADILHINADKKDKYTYSLYDEIIALDKQIGNN
ncbi:MAG: hypothetical protein ACON5F_10380 [Jejuia sp.]